MINKSKNISLTKRILLVLIPTFLLLLMAQLVSIQYNRIYSKRVNEIMESSKSASNKFRQFRGILDEFLNQKKDITELEKAKNEVLEAKSLVQYKEDINKLFELCKIIDNIKIENARIRSQVFEIANHGISQSDTYINEVVKRLADEAQADKVSKLEKLVIAGALVNTTTNYQLLLIFERLPYDTKARQEIREYFKVLLENVEKDIQRLKGTDFEKLPVLAKEAALKNQTLTEKYIANLESLEKNILAMFDLRRDLATRIDTEPLKVASQSIYGITGISVKTGYVMAAILLLGILGVIYFMSRITKVVTGVAQDMEEVTEMVLSSSNEILRANESLASSTSEQAAATEQMSSSLEELSAITKQNADSSRNANNLMEMTLDRIKALEESLKRLSAYMSEVKKAGEETSKIVKTIDEIAFQTNLLALNAAVEAARAGEAGAGFAVVADEVRALAMKAAEAAKNSSMLIGQTVEKVKQGTVLLEGTDHDFKEVFKAVNDASVMMAEIASSSAEQSTGIAQVSKAVAEVDRGTQQNAATAEETASLAQELAHQAERLKAATETLLSFLGKGATLDKVQESTFSKTQKPLLKPPQKTKAPLKGQEIGPNELISLEDEELKRF